MTLLTLLGDLAPAGLARVSWPAKVERAGLMLANLETPFCGAGLIPAPKAGPHLRADPALLPGLAEALAPLVVSLANNHSMDYGTAGLAATLAATRAAGIRTVGAGASRRDAGAGLTVELGGVRVAMVAGTDRWFGAAEEEAAGVALLGPDLIRAVRRARAEADVVVASVHGGGEVSPWPSPAWQQQLRLLAESGAQVVHAHHPHVALGWERWAEGWVFYGLGNTLVHPARWPAPEWTRCSWRVQLDVAHLDRAPRIAEWEVAADGVDGARLSCVCPAVADGDPAVAERNAPLADPLLLEGLHQEYALRLWEAFYADRVNLGDTAARRARLAGRTVRDQALALFAPARGRGQRRDRGLFHYHLFSSATHAEEIATALGVITGERPDRRDERTRRLAARWLPASLFSP